MVRAAAIFLVSFSVWLLLAWPFAFADGRLVECRADEILAGVAVALLAALVMRNVSGRRFRLLLSPVRAFWFVVYLVVLAYYIVKANFDVAYRVLHPAMPIRPGIVKVKTSLKTLAGITALSNSITLTPGTLVVHAAEDGALYVHWIYVRATEAEAATRHIVSRFEWFLKRIFE